MKTYNPLPTPEVKISIDVSAIRDLIITKVAAVEGDIAEAVEHELEAAVSAYNFEAAVRHEAKYVIDQAISDFFRIGYGKRLLHVAVTSALNKEFRMEE